MTRTNSEVSARVLMLRGIFADRPAYRLLEEQLSLFLERRRAELDAGVTHEARGIAVIGASGSGKTTAVARAIAQTELKTTADHAHAPRQIVSLQVPSPATVKFVGQAVLNAIGYPLRRDKSAAIIWGMVRDHLAANQVLFLHLDEAQDLSLHKLSNERQPVINTLKSLMQNASCRSGSSFRACRTSSKC